MSAEALLKSYGILRPEDIDLEAIAFDQGAIIRRRPLDHCEARLVGLKDRAIITIRDDLTLPRQRFSVAHELGHWLNHRGTVGVQCSKNDIGLSKSQGRGREAAANSFAGELLMPEYLFRPRAEGKAVHFGIVSQLRDQFRTSLTATAIRLVQLSGEASAVAAYTRGQLVWVFNAPSIPGEFRLKKRLPPDLLEQRASTRRQIRHMTRPQRVSADRWIDDADADLFFIVEHVIAVNDDTLVVLLWWQDREQLWQFIRLKED